MNSEETRFFKDFQNIPKEIQETFKQEFAKTRFFPQIDSQIISEPIQPESKQEDEERYEILKTLGQGGMGLVQLARDSLLQRNVAIKTIRLKDLRTQVLSQYQEVLLWRLKKEAEITALLEHPNIVPLYDLQKKKNGEIYFTMRHIQGETFSSLLNKKKQGKATLDKEDLLTIFTKVCDAVAYAHSQGIIHRDLKPDNVMVGQFGEVYVMDWGIAKRITKEVDLFDQKIFSKILENNQHESTKIFDRDSEEFKTLGGIGTVGYMAPEQAKNSQNVREQADIHALGKILKQCFTYCSPTQELKDLITLRQSLLNKELHQISQKTLKQQEIPEDIHAIVEKATHPDWQKRYTSVKELILDVERYRKHWRVSARKYNFSQILRKWAKRNQRTLWMTTVIATLLIGFWGYLNYQTYQEFESNMKQAQAEKIWGDQEKHQETKMDHWLKGLYAIDTALLLAPQHQTVAKIKFELSQSLVKSACETRDFQFASYFVRGVERLETVKTEDKIRLKETVKFAKTKSLREHQKRLNYWKKELKNPKSGMREEALLEINKMEEPEILEDLAKEVQAGTQYFLTHSKRTSKENEYYEIMAVALGSLENPKAGHVLWKSLELISEEVLRFREGYRSDIHVQYMVSLAQALSYSKASEFAEKLRILRQKMGMESLFSKRTEMPFRKLALLENLDAQYQTHSAQEFFDRAHLREELKDFSGAIEDYTKVIDLNPHYFEAYTNRGGVKKENGDLQGAIDDYTEAIRLNPQSYLSYYSRGIVKFEKADYEGAINDYTEAIRLNPQYAEAYTNRALAKEEKGNKEGALLDYTEAIHLNPHLFEAYSNRGALKIEKGDIDGALLDYTEAIRLNPQSSVAYSNRGQLKEFQGDIDGAILDYTEAIRLNPQNSNFYYNRGNMRVNKKDLLGANLDFTEAIRLNPDHVQSYINRGLSHANQGNFDSALLDYTEAIRRNPKIFQAYANRGLLRMNRKDKKGAIEDFEKAIELHPDPKLMNTLTEVLKQQSREAMNQKDWENAKITLQKLKKYLPPNDLQHKQLDEKLRQLETLIQTPKPK